MIPRRHLFFIAAICLAVAAAFFIEISSASAANGYRYNGRPVCLPQATLTLASAQVAGGHVAVWSGVYASGSAQWAQAGVASYPGKPPFAYLESRTSAGYRLQRLHLGRSLSVSVEQRGGSWVVAAGGRTARLRLAQARCFAGAESFDDGPVNGVSGSVGSFGVGL